MEGLIFSQLLKECRVRLNRRQHFCRQPRWVTSSGFPAFNGIHAGSQRLRHFRLRNVQPRSNGLHVSNLIASHAGRGFIAIFDINRFFERRLKLIKKLISHLIFQSFC